MAVLLLRRAHLLAASRLYDCHPVEVKLKGLPAGRSVSAAFQSWRQLEMCRTDCKTAKITEYDLIASIDTYARAILLDRSHVITMLYRLQLRKRLVW